MSFNSDASSPAASGSTARDWIFPSYSFVHSPHNIRRTPRRRRFSSYHPPPQQFNSSSPPAFTAGEGSNSESSSVSRLRPRSFELGNHEKSTISLADGLSGPTPAGIKSNDAVSENQTTASEKTFSSSLRGSFLRIRPKLAFSVSVSSLLYIVAMDLKK